MGGYISPATGIRLDMLSLKLMANIGEGYAGRFSLMCTRCLENSKLLAENETNGPVHRCRS